MMERETPSPRPSFFGHRASDPAPAPVAAESRLSAGLAWTDAASGGLRIDLVAAVPDPALGPNGTDA